MKFPSLSTTAIKSEALSNNRRYFSASFKKWYFLKKLSLLFLQFCLPSKPFFSSSRSVLTISIGYSSLFPIFSSFDLMDFDNASFLYIPINFNIINIMKYLILHSRPIIFENIELIDLSFTNLEKLLYIDTTLVFLKCIFHGMTT
jgi:hypothetical protein